MVGVGAVRFPSSCDSINCHLRLEGTKVTMIRMAHEHGIGDIDLGAVEIRRIETA